MSCYVHQAKVAAYDEIKRKVISFVAVMFELVCSAVKAIDLLTLKIRIE